MRNIHKKVRFIVVGVINTIIDFGVFGILVGSGISSIIANYPATTTALIFSFFANKNYTFRDKKNSKKQKILFLIVTLAGAWIVQPIILFACTNILSGFDNLIEAMLAKICAATASMLWNYMMYDTFVFSDKH
ncbi:MAG: GtrA family protein [Candidatus Saccharimonadales bacterium]